MARSSRSSLKMSYENEIGALPPTGFKDPLGLSKDTDATKDEKGEMPHLAVNAVYKIETEIEEVKQAIKDVQLAIVNAGEKIEKVKIDIEATMNQLLDDNLSPSKNILLTKMIDSLVDEKKALMDEKKALMDKEKALMDKEKALMDKEKALVSYNYKDLKPFEFLMDDYKNFPDHEGGKIIFKREWLIKSIADMALTKNDENAYRSYYWRAPIGSGKTVFLKLIGKEMQNRGCDVYYLEAADMQLFHKNYFHQLSQNAGDKTVVLLIDEVQNSVVNVHWVDILKGHRPKNLLVLGVGIPRLEPASPQFSLKFPTNKELFPMFLTTEDMPEVAASFSRESSQKGIKKLCEQVLVFTNGHLFPFVKIMEHLLNKDVKRNVSDAATYLCSQAFRGTESYANIKNRCEML